MAVQETEVLVLADGDTAATISNARGHLFERFVAKVLERYGYVRPSVRNLNVTQDGIELDVAVNHRVLARAAIAECKAHSSPVKAKELTSFYGKLGHGRLTSSEPVDGFFFALPRLVQQGDEQAREIERHDSGFKYLSADEVVEALRELNLLADCPESLTAELLSDPSVLITEHGLYSAAKVLDKESRTALSVVAWGIDGPVPASVLTLLQQSHYSDGLAVREARERQEHIEPNLELERPAIVEVRGGDADFDYYLPASPRYFVGRRSTIADIESALARPPQVVVVNAQSGWGKSSLALKLRQSAEKLGGIALIVDTRTATHRDFVPAVLRHAAVEATRRNAVRLPDDASWSSLSAALDTLSGATWGQDAGPILIFFDQFENVFRNEDLTRAFRDLALGVHEIQAPVVVGFAWKTDLVAWTEEHPYHLRDDIKSQARLVRLEPLGPSEIGILLGRLEKQLNAKVLPDLKQRLREYSQGLPWLFKKLAGHVLSEVNKGVTQSELVSEALNVQGLFESDLAELQPVEHEGLLYIARYAPVPVSEVMDRVSAPVIQSLVDRRLVVRVGERLDTYWDIFRDFLVTGRVPIQESYILRQAPHSVGRMLRHVLTLGGQAPVHELAGMLGTSENVVFNLARELRLMGCLAYEPNSVKLATEITASMSREQTLRGKVAFSLRRHKAFSLMTRLLEQQKGRVHLASFSRALPAAFPAVAAVENTWAMYGRSFAQWFEYAGLIRLTGQFVEAADESEIPEVRLLSDVASRRWRHGLFPSRSPGPAFALLKELAAEGGSMQATPERQRNVRDLLKLGVVDMPSDDEIVLTRPQILCEDGDIDQGILRLLLGLVPGTLLAHEHLRTDPAATVEAIGALLREESGSSCADSTAALSGKYFRAWARAAGVDVAPQNRTGDAD